MPDPMFREATKNLDITDDEAMARVARQFKVGVGVLAYRMSLP